MGIFDQSILRGRRVLPGLLRVGPSAPHNFYQKIIDIFGIDSIEILLASDGEGGLKDYVTQDGATVTDNTTTSDVSALSTSFDVSATAVSFSSSFRKYENGTPLELFSVGIFGAPMSMDGLESILTINNMIGYFGKLGEMFIYNASDSVGYRSARGLSEPSGNDFYIWSGDKASNTMSMEAANGKETISDFPSGVSTDEIRLVHYGIDGLEYTAQFWIILNRTMTDPEIAQVRALL